MRISSLQFLGICCALYVASIAAVAPADFLVVLWQHVIILVLSLPIILAVTVGIAGYVDNPAAPMKAARKLLGNSQLWSAAGIMLVFILSVAAYNTFKFNIPHIVPFYADPFLASWDELLHGQPTWRIAHQLPQTITSAIVDFFYSIIWFGQWFGVVVYVSIWKGGARKDRYLWALALTTLIVGTVMATAFSSVGPIFYDRFYGGGRFADLTEMLQTPTVKRFAKYLIETYDGRTASFGSGISAMPSMHIAIATLNALFLSSMKRSLAVAGWTFLAIMQFGSVYTGWHYAIDGYVSMLSVGTIWWLTGWYFLSAKPADPTKAPVRTKTAAQPARIHQPPTSPSFSPSEQG